MVRKPGDVEKSLERKGFQRKEGDHHYCEVHEPEQGLWFASMPLCTACHRGPEGWHGTRLRWKLRKVSELGRRHDTRLPQGAGNLLRG